MKNTLRNKLESLQHRIEEKIFGIPFSFWDDKSGDIYHEVKAGYRKIKPGDLKGAIPVRSYFLRLSSMGPLVKSKCQQGGADEI